MSRSNSLFWGKNHRLFWLTMLLVVVLGVLYDRAQAGPPAPALVECGVTLELLEAQAASMPGETAETAQEYYEYYCDVLSARDAFLLAPVVDNVILDRYFQLLEKYHRYMLVHPLLGTADSNLQLPTSQQLQDWFVMMRQAMAYSSVPLKWANCDASEVEVTNCQMAEVTGPTFVLKGISLDTELTVYIATAEFETARTCNLTTQAFNPNSVWSCPWSALLYRPLSPVYENRDWIQFLETGQVFPRPDRAQEPGS